MKLYVLRHFDKWRRKERLSDRDLCAAFAEMKAGLIEAQLGAMLVKKRIARAGNGKRDGFRTIVMLQLETRAVFLYGFPKNAKDNLSAKELESYRAIAKLFAGFKQAEMDLLVASNKASEVNCDEC